MAAVDTDSHATQMDARRNITEKEAERLYPDPVERRLSAPSTFFYQPLSFAFKQGFPIKAVRLFEILEGSVEIGLFDKGGIFIPFLTVSPEAGDRFVMIPVESKKSEFTVKTGKEACYLKLTDEDSIKDMLKKSEKFAEGLAKVQSKLLLEICRKFSGNIDGLSSVTAISSLILKELKDRPNLAKQVLEMLGRHVADLQDFWDEPIKLRAQPFQELIGSIEETYEQELLERKLLVTLLANPTPRDLIDSIIRISKVTPEFEDEQLRLMAPMFVKMAKTGTSENPVSYYMVAKRLQEGIVHLGGKLIERLKS